MPSCTKEHNPTVYVKASKRYKQIMADYKERDEPMAIKAWKVLPSPKNRLGAPLNINYIHVDLAGNVLNKNGWDPKRPKPGVVVRRTNPDKIKKLREHAKTMHATAPRLFPPVAVDSPEAIYECIAANHLTCLLNLIGNQMVSDITKQSFAVPKDDNELKNVVESGHVYYIIRDDIPDEDLEFLSEYLNSDQHENQCTSEIATLSQVDRAIAQELKNTPHPKVSTIVRIVSNESMLKLRPDNIGDMAHYCINLSGTSQLKQLVNWHSRYVNPRELTVSPVWLGGAAKAMGKTFPLSLMGMTFLQYRGDLKTLQTRPNPDISRAIGLPEINSLMKDSTIGNLEKTEEFLRDTIKLLQVELQGILGEVQTDFAFNLLQEAAARLLLSKDMKLEFEHGVSGKWTMAKLESLRAAWVRHLEDKHKFLKGLGANYGIVAEDIGSSVPDDEVI